MNTDEARKEAVRVDRMANTTTVWFQEPVMIEKNELYVLRHCLQPTDVTNHYSGFPVTLLGANIWTMWGKGGSPKTEMNEVQFKFQDSNMRGRSCLKEGQMPNIYFWKME